MSAEPGGEDTNSRERFLDALQGRKPDRTPLAYVSAMTNQELQRESGCFMPAAHLDAEQLARLCAAAHELFGFDGVTFIQNYFNEPAALGCSMNWGTAGALPVYTSHPWARIEEAAVPADLLDRAPISTYLETIRIAGKRYGDRMAVLGKVMGPFSMAQVMHGVERLILGLVDNPGLVRQLLELCTELLVRCANAQFEAGIDALAIGEGGAGANMLSPAMYDDMLLDIHRKMIGSIQGPTIMHICGDITARLDSLGRIGLCCFSFDHTIEPGHMREKSSGVFKIMGNINTADLLNGTPADITSQVYENLEAGVDIIGPGCAISPLCPSANIRAMSRAIHMWHERMAV